MDEKELRKQTNPGFRFIVEVDGLSSGVFTECTLPVVEWEIEEIKEGGLNVYTHQLPGRRKGARITLKNGVGSSKLVDWYLKMMTEEFKRREVTIVMKDSMLDPVMTWKIEAAYPIKWTGPALKASENSIAIQTLELACGEITIT